MSNDKKCSSPIKQPVNGFVEMIKKKPVVISICAGCIVLVIVTAIVLLINKNSDINTSMQAKLETKFNESYSVELTTEESDEYTLYELQEDGSYAEVTYEDPIEDLNNLIQRQ